MKPETSSCCNAPATFYHVANEVPSLWICSNCGKRCIPEVGAPVEREVQPTGKVPKELIDSSNGHGVRVCYRDSTGNIVNSHYITSKDVEEIKAAARAEGAQEEREKLKRITTTLFELYDKVDGSIKNLHTINQVVGDENRKELENNIRYLLGYISGLKIGLLGDDALTTKEHHAE